MKVVLLKDEETTDGPKRAGTIIEHKDAAWLVRLGKAVEYKEPEPAPAAEPAQVAASPSEVSEEPTNDSGADAASSEDRAAG